MAYLYDKKRISAALLALSVFGPCACKNDNFGKTPSAESSPSSTDKNKTPAAVEREPAIPRIEYPNDQGGPNNFEVGEEASIATDITGTYLSIPKGILDLGKAIAIRSTQKVADAVVQSIKVVIPKKTSATEENLVVLYRMTSEKGENFYGLIPKKDLEVQDGSVSFQPKGLGVYQAAVTPALIAEARQVPILGAAKSPRLKLISTYKTPGTPSDILLTGTIAYVADGSGVEVLNWSTASGFTPNTRIAGTGLITSISSAGTRLFVGAGLSGLGMIDLAKPLSLQYVDSRGNANSLAVADNLRNIYLTQEKTADGQSRAGISRFDIQQDVPKYEVTAPIGADQGNPENGYSVQIQATFAFALSRSSVSSYDITQNDRVNLLSALALDGTAEKLLLYSNRLYIAQKTGGIVSVDALNPAALKALGQLPLPLALDVAGKDKYLIAIDGNKKASLIDISDPSHLLVLHELTLSGTPTRVRVFGETIVVTMSDAGLAVLGIETP